MSSIWHFLSGEVPGGFMALIVLLIALYLVLEYVYRSGQLMPRATYRRVRRIGTLVIIMGYALIWIQSPPKTEPLRIAVISAGKADQSDWRSGAIADLTGRRLEKTLGKAIVNPWNGAVDEYAQPSAEILQRAKYHVYQVRFEERQENKPAELQVAKSGNVGHTFTIAKTELGIISEEVSKWILADLGKNAEPAKPFHSTFQSGVIDAYYQGLHYFKVEQTDSARIRFNDALTVDSTFTPAKVGLALCFERGGDPKRAALELLSAVKADTGSLEAMLSLGEFHLRHMEWDLAEPPLKVVLTRDPLAVRTYLGLASLHSERLLDLRLNTPDALLEEAIRLDPAFEPARVALASRLINIGLAQKARPILREGLKINPESVNLLLKIGAVELYSGNTGDAREAYQKIIELDPENAIAAFNLGVVAYRTKQYEEALQHFANSLEWGGSIDSYYYLGLIYRTRGDSARAGVNFKKRWELRKSEDDVFALKAKEYARAIGLRIEEQVDR